MVLALTVSIGAVALGACASTTQTTGTPTATSPGTSIEPPAGTSSTTAHTGAGTTTQGTAPGTTMTGDQPTGVNAAGEITDVRTVRAFLYSVVKSWGEPALDPEQLAKGLRQTYAELDLSGYAVESTSTTISLISTYAHEKDDPSATNPAVIAFAVKGVDGTCVGGVIYGFPLPTTTLDLKADAGDPCTGRAMLDAALPKIAG